MTFAIIVLTLAIIFGYLIISDNKKPNMEAQNVESNTEPQEAKEELSLTSSVFEHMGSIPAHYTCDGVKVNPPLAISGITPEAKSLVLIMEDPDVPKSARADGMWDHWIKFNLSPDLKVIEEGKDPGGVSGINTSDNLKYVPPCPPDREHRYFFYLYSLDTTLDLKEGVTKIEVLSAIEGHILQKTELVGLYNRQ